MNTSKKFQRSEQFITSDLGEAIILSDIQSDMFYGTNSVGSAIWTLLTEPLSINELTTELMSQFEIDEATCLKEVAEFIEELSKVNAVKTLTA